MKVEVGENKYLQQQQKTSRFIFKIYTAPSGFSDNKCLISTNEFHLMLLPKIKPDKY